MLDNIILNTDSYKTSHWRMYPPGTERVYCYIESRGGRWPQTLFFGLQALLKESLTMPVFDCDIDEAETIFASHGVPFNRAGWQHIVDSHHGYLPVSIRAVPEGAVLPTRNVLVTIENTDPACYWLPTYLETALLRAVWYPTTVATNSWFCKQIIKIWLDKTCDDPAGQIDFKLHDFGGRGASSEESAGLGGMAHLVNFKGTDTLSGIVAARRYYKADMPGFSIPATEHSTIIAWGKRDELAAYKNVLDQFGGAGRIVACVSDSYDFWHALRTLWCGELKEHVKSHGGTLVIRPDSGEPAIVVRQALDILGEAFGVAVNSKGYKVLPSCVRLIQGDGVNDKVIDAVLTKLAMGGWSAENVAFGMGGGLLQQVDRDTLRFAMKASEVVVNGEAHAISKSPIGDPTKASKAGRLALTKSQTKDGWHWWTTTPDSVDRDDELVEVFRDGAILKEWSFDEVRGRAAES